MTKYLLALGLAVSTSLVAAQDLKVAIDASYEPFTYKTPDGKPTGFDVDIAQAICDQLKRKCVFVEQVWDSMIPGLQARKYDVIISSMSITDDRLKVVDFSDKYYNTPSTTVVKAGTAYTGPASLKGKKIGVLKGSTQEKYALGELKPAGAAIVPYEAQDQVYLDLKAGRLDGTIADRVEVKGGFLDKADGKGFAMVGPDLSEVKYYGHGVGVAMRKGQDKLKADVNGAIKAIRADGRYEKIAKKYFDFDVYGK